MTQDEEMALRELAAKPHYLPQVAAALGPMSLWSRAGLEAEIRKVVEAEREACAKVCEQSEIPIAIDVWLGSTKKEISKHTALALAAYIRARGEQA